MHIATAMGPLKIHLRHTVRQKKKEIRIFKKKDTLSQKASPHPTEKCTVETKKKRHLGAVMEHVVEFVKAQVSWRLCLVPETQSLPLPPLQEY